MSSSIIGVNDTARNSALESPISTIIAAGVRAIIGPNYDPVRVLEVRSIVPAAISGKYYAREIDALARDAAAFDGKRNLYLLLNQPKSHRFAFSHTLNRLREVKRTHGEADMLCRDAFVIDIDPARAEGHKKNPASEAEQAEAWKVSAACIEYLSSRNWPEPVIVSTGNGYQIIYHIETLSTESDLIRRTLTALGAKFSTLGAKIDPSVANASRIIRLPGTINRKGTASPDRPYRRAELIQAGDDRRVTVAQIEAEAASTPPTPTPVRSVTPSTRISVSRSSSDTINNLDRRVYAYLDSCPGAIEGAGGRSTTFRVAGSLVNGYALSEDDAFRYLIDSGWNDRCSPPWPEHQLRERIHAAAVGSKVGYRSLLDTERHHETHSDDILKLFLPDPKPRVTGREIALELASGRVFDDRSANPTPEIVSDDVRDTGINTVDTRISHKPETLTEAPPETSSSPPSILARLIGQPPEGMRCSNPVRRLAEGVSEETCGMDALFVIACGHWTCGCCRERRRHHEKQQNVPVAFYHATHTFTGTVSEWHAARMRLDRIRVDGRTVKIRRESYVVSQGGEQIAAVVAVAEADLHLVPDLAGLTPATPEAAAIFVAEAIDRIPDFELGDSKRCKIKRFRPSRNWNELTASAAVASPFGSVSAVSNASESRWSFVPGIVVGDHAEIARILAQHRQSYAADTMVNLPSGGAIEHTLVWRAEGEARYAIRRDVLHLPADSTPETDFALGITRPAKRDGEPNAEDDILKLMGDWGSRT